MNEVLKQRLVGALILVALGVIFWPIVFVQPDSTDLVPQRSIPPQPGVSTEPVASPDRVGLRGSPERYAAIEAVTDGASGDDPETDDEASSQPAAPEPVAQPEPPPAATKPARTVAAAARQSSPEPVALDADGVPVAWMLQVVSVSSEEKAESLRQRLLEMDKKAYIASVNANGKKLYRVYIGPKFEKAKLEAMRAQIDAEFGVQSMVRRYVP
ncbi:MAG: SPOR domain-containing protein [Halioglobus sp.]